MEVPREPLGEAAVSKSKKKVSIGDLHLLDFKTRMKYSLRYSPYLILDEFERSEDPEIYLEEMRKHNQWKLARQIKKRTALRLGVGQSGTSNSTDEKVDAGTSNSLDEEAVVEEQCPGSVAFVVEDTDSDSDSGESYDSFDWHDGDEEDTNPGTLKLASEVSRPIKLNDVTIYLDGGRYRETIGTLEAHVNGFRYSTFSPNFQLDFMFNNVKHSFFQVEKEKTVPLLHFHFDDDIMVGTEKTKNIQFHFVQKPVGTKRYADGLDKIEEKRDIGQDLRKFVYEVQAIWKFLPKSFFPIEKPENRFEFHGVLNSKTAAVFAVTLYCLIQLVEQPFVVVRLSEIEIVNLAQVGVDQIHMTVVFQDFGIDVLKVSSIPIASLFGIKKWLNLSNVKYYENNEYDGWETIGKTIIDNPEKFIADGGWEFLNRDASSDSESESEYFEEFCRSTDF